MSERDFLLDLWNRHHNSNTWITGFAAAVSGLTPEQAAWTPGAGQAGGQVPGGAGTNRRHSIWQIVHHMSFWREYHVSRTRTDKTLPDAEIERLNWLAPEAVTASAWEAAVARFAASHAAVADAIADEAFPLEKLPFILTHDAYHTGQIMTLRAMQGLPPVE